MWEKCQGIYHKFGIIKKICVLVSGIATLFMMFFISADVVMRNVTGSSIPGCYELVQGYLMILVSVPAMAFAFSEGVMPRVDVLINKFRFKRKRMIISTAIVIDIIIIATFTVFSTKYAIAGFEERTVFMAGIKYYPVYFMFPLIPIAFAMIIIENIFILIRNWTDNKAEMTTGANETENLFIN